jgi:(p)ppGpp synthase/HD superfamily hydrolase
MLEQLAENFCSIWHKGQKRKFDNEPYYNHPKRVVQSMKAWNSSERHFDDASFAIAWLHDIIEDTCITEEILTQAFGNHIVSHVKELTNNRKDYVKFGNKTKYMIHKFNTISHKSFVIKLFDRLDNVSDFASAEPDFIEFYGKQTLDILDGLDRKDYRPMDMQIMKQIKHICEFHINRIGANDD